ncbi:MAG: AbrB/MazE/SpoVT family DNA-binding domain-containing protein [Thermoleophilia bacterium]
MDTVTISPKFQVVIPKSIRDRLKLIPGQKVQAIAYGERIEFIPIRPAKELRGVLRGLDTSFERDEEDRV